MILSSQFSSNNLFSTGGLIYDPTPTTRLTRASVINRKKRFNFEFKSFETQPRFYVRAAASEKLSVAVSTVTKTEEDVKVKGVVTVKRTLPPGLFSGSKSERRDDDPAGTVDKILVLELVSSELDPETGGEKETVKAYAKKARNGHDSTVIYECEFKVPVDFGHVGAVTVEILENDLQSVMFVDSIVIEDLPDGHVSFNCNSWVHSNHGNATKRVFFSNKSYLPSKTPTGLKKLREKELQNLRGNGQGERQKFDRIYDYDTYNDLGDPDADADLSRPVLGGSEHSYPRRGRTGRPRCKTDPETEQKASGGDLLGGGYVPRDEVFSDVKLFAFGKNALASVLHSLIPNMESQHDQNKGFRDFKDIDSLFDDGFNVSLPPNCPINIPWLIEFLKESGEAILRFELPQLLEKEESTWSKDEEFARQMLAGVNPYSIQLVTPQEWPLTSKLDSETYGSPESLITKELVEEEIGGAMTVEQALDEKRLFMLDYHDLFLPYVHKVRQLKGRMLYGSRTLLYRNDDHTLRLIAIELTRPKHGRQPQWREVFRPSSDPTKSWLWRLAKAHVAAHDAGYHQLVVHWLRTHCCTEPYIIAANRQLSAMHPIYRLLHPYFRYTMEMNALARDKLISAGGGIESGFSTGKYSMELSSVIYNKFWRFDMESLPADLIRRGMAVPDPTAEHGLKLAIEDYPFANDGLILWDAIKQWVTDYVNHYYPEPAGVPNFVESDRELQAWWTEVRTKGHPDKKEGWPILNTQKDLIQILSTIIWVTSGHHAAVNFGQYPYAGYFPNRPSITRTKMPTEEDEEFYEEFLKNPESVLMKTYPSQIQAMKVMVVLDILSNHSPDEEYVGKKPEASWEENPVINAAFKRFHGRLKVLEGIIDGRNADSDLKNRTGAGVVPYELLKPYSGEGVTCKGVPNSISI